ncbi:HAD family hydrolase [Acidipropionibacterium acidipropionici]|uniref:HAD family hydrolase n=1 Tax=Acidipropionibacterium acidipropionici TaxID=1748 RepID=UPI00110BC517|nr:HAD-IA family hydrolase [Acidipropionibacterium acidipropionici]QCV96018.1 HAD family hydrolase [Acidipropionibacterium acidipropionici]
MGEDLGPLAGCDFEAVLFDSDGTLIDSTAVVERCWARWTAEFGVDPADARHGVPVIEIVNELIEPARRSRALARIRELELGDIDGVVPMPGAVDALRALDAATSAIATSCDRDLMEVRIAASRIPAPPVVITRTDVEHGKPSPDPWLLAASRLGADPARCLVVEDSQAGLDAARAAGCATLALRTTTSGDLDADAVVDDLSWVRFTKESDGVHVTLR